MGDELQQAEDLAAAQYTELRRQGTSSDDAARALCGKRFPTSTLSFLPVSYFRRQAIEVSRFGHKASLWWASIAGVRRAAAALGDLTPAAALAPVRLGDCTGRKTGES